jgi:hypothetical protein
MVVKAIRRVLDADPRINGSGQVASLYEARQEISSALSLLRRHCSRVLWRRRR